MDIEITSDEGQELLKKGAHFLRGFHSEYKKDPASLRTEHWRSKLSGWRETIEVAFGRNVADSMIEDVRLTTGLSIPHAGPLTADGKGYLGDDPHCDSYVGEVPPAQLAVRQFERQSGISQLRKS